MHVRNLFAREPGDELDASGDCQIAPASVGVGNVTGDATYDFTTGGGCVTSIPSNLTSTDSLHTLSQAGSQFGAVVATTIEPTSDDPAGRLQEIATELPTCSLDIAGDSAIEQQGVMTVEGPLDGTDMMQTGARHCDCSRQSGREIRHRIGARRND
jgi:hypothetical protein